MIESNDSLITSILASGLTQDAYQALKPVISKYVHAEAEALLQSKNAIIRVIDEDVVLPVINELFPIPAVVPAPAATS